MAGMVESGKTNRPRRGKGIKRLIGECEGDIVSDLPRLSGASVKSISESRKSNVRPIGSWWCEGGTRSIDLLSVTAILRHWARISSNMIPDHRCYYTVTNSRIIAFTSFLFVSRLSNHESHFRPRTNWQWRHIWIKIHSARFSFPYN